MKRTLLIKLPHESVTQRRAHRKHQVLQFATEVFGNQEMANVWLTTEIPALGGRMPKSLLETIE